MPGMGKRLRMSKVEESALHRIGQKLIYPPTEKMGVIVVEDFSSLGKLTALRFLEWVQANPAGVVSLPTGKTPTYFIKWVMHYLRTWDDSETQKDLVKNGVDVGVRPNMGNLHFVQIDEFYPIRPTEKNSFYYQVKENYISGFGLDQRRALLIDCSQIGLPPKIDLVDTWPGAEVDLSLRHRHPHNNQERLQKRILEAIDQWCYEYEEKIRSLGGIGFFLGGIGPDGHVAFNVMGADHHSTTRLTPTNYETQAAASTDLGGIEVSRKRLAITIGLATITYAPDCTAIIIAAGETKAGVVRDAVQEIEHIRYPATVLHKLANSRFYVTQGAASLLDERRYEGLIHLETVPGETVERTVIDLALKSRKRLRDLDERDFKQDRFAATVLKRVGRSPSQVTGSVEKTLLERIEAGSRHRGHSAFFHIAHHCEDIALGYMPYVVRHTTGSSNRHTFLLVPSNVTRVTDRYLLALLQKLDHFLKQGAFDKLFERDDVNPDNRAGRDRDVRQYLDGMATDSPIMKDEGEARRLLRNLLEVFGKTDIDHLNDQIDELIQDLRNRYPGENDPPHFQHLKRLIREWENDCFCGYLGLEGTVIEYVRLGAHKTETLEGRSKVDRDEMVVLKLLRKARPDLIMVPLAPRASGSDSDETILQNLARALRRFEQETDGATLEVVGYRSVWSRFHLAEANIYVPVSSGIFSVLQRVFLNTFPSQKAASFPSFEHDGPLSELAQEIQVRQFQMLETCLGRQFFAKHPSPAIQEAKGFVFFRKMTLAEFSSYVSQPEKP